MDWQPIKTAPHWDTVLLFVPPTPTSVDFALGLESKPTINIGFYERGVGWRIQRYPRSRPKPTHWMPLPDPPQS